MRNTQLSRLTRRAVLAASLASAVLASSSVLAQRQGGPGGQRGQGQRPAAGAQRAQQPQLPQVELKGAERFNVAHKPLVPGLYQVGYSDKNNALFVTSSVGRQVSSTELVKVNPETLEIIARAEIQPAPGGDVVHAVYGIGVDDANDTLWVTNTRTGTSAVYQQSDLSLVKQFEAGATNHSRDAIIDTKRGKAYVSGRDPVIHAFDAKTLEPLTKIELKTTVADEEAAFTPMSLALDVENGKLYSVSMRTGEVVVINTANDTVEKLFAVKNAERASGVGYDSVNNRILVANQGSGNLLIVDPDKQEVLHDVFVGAGALNVSFEPVSQLAFVTVRGGNSIAVVNAAGELVANLDGGPNPNHLTVDGKGNVFAVNKGGADNEASNNIWRIQAKNN